MFESTTGASLGREHVTYWRNIGAAYAAAGLDVESAPELAAYRNAAALADRLRELAATDPTVSAALRLDPGADDLDARLADLARRRALATLAGDAVRLWGSYEGSAMRGHVLAALPTVVERLRPAFAKAAHDLATAARSLPAGDAALDANAIIAADASKAYRAAQAAVSKLEAFGAVLPASGHAGWELPDGAAVCRIVALPDAGEPGTAGRPDSEAPERAVIRAVPRDFHSAATLTLVRVARDEYAGAAFDLAADGEDFAARIENVKQAHRWLRAPAGTHGL